MNPRCTAPNAKEVARVGVIRSTILELAAVAVLCAASAFGQELPPTEPSAADRSSAAAPAGAPTVAIIEFDFAAVHQWWAVELAIGKGIADLVTDGLVNDGTYRVIERRFVESILAEQDLAADKQRSDPSADLVRAGKLVGAQYMVVGSVTRFGTETETKGGVAALIGHVSGLGLVGREKGKAVVNISARLIDATTGVVVASVTAEAKSSRKGLLFGALGGGAFGGASVRSAGFRETILGEAIQQAVHQIVERLVAAKPRLTPQP